MSYIWRWLASIKPLREIARGFCSCSSIPPLYLLFLFSSIHNWLKMILRKHFDFQNLVFTFCIMLTKSSRIRYSFTSGTYISIRCVDSHTCCRLFFYVSSTEAKQVLIFEFRECNKVSHAIYPPLKFVRRKHQQVIIYDIVFIKEFSSYRLYQLEYIILSLYKSLVVTDFISLNIYYCLYIWVQE